MARRDKELHRRVAKSATTATRTIPAWHALGWPLGFLTLSFFAQRMSDVSGNWEWRRSEFLAGAWWQLLTCQWVHFNGLHAALNIAVMVLMMLVFDRRVDRLTQVAALVGGYVGVAIVLVLDPVCTYYAGASGAVHGFLAGNALALVGSRWRTLGLTVLVALAVKLGLQHDGEGVLAPHWQGLSVYTPAHEAGALGGLIAVALLLALRRRPFDAH
jgi:rhomboid family GlyGly-CTERM serine protease